MIDILHEVAIAAPAGKVFNAITEQDGLRAWWSEHSTAEPRVGTMTEVMFYGGAAHFKLSVDELTSGKRVVWGVQQGPPEWANTHMTWDLSDDDGKTTVLFGHRGFASTEGNFANTNYTWGLYLTSLKAYLETGTGHPHTDADMAG